MTADIDWLNDGCANVMRVSEILYSGSLWLTKAGRSTDNALSMNIQRAAALVTSVGLVLGSMLPPEHMHRVASRLHGHSFVHRHFAPHTTANGTHLDHPAAAEGVPHWLDDPRGSTPDPPVVRAEPTGLLFYVLRPPLATSDDVAPPSEPSVHAPPDQSIGLRAPPFHS
jgi:hypothetical protein